MDVDINADMDMDACINADMDVDMDADINADMYVDMDAYTDMDMDTDMDMAADVDTDMDTDIKTCTQPEGTASPWCGAPALPSGCINLEGRIMKIGLKINAGCDKFISVIQHG